MAASILSFLSTTDLFASKSRTLLSVGVGVLAIVSTFVQVLSDQLKWSIRAEMHKSASLDLKQIVDDLDFQQISRIGSMSETAKIAVLEYHKMYSQIMIGCKSYPPLEITQAFTALESRMLIKFGEKKTDEIIVAAGNELYCSITKYWLWPWKIQDADRMLSGVINAFDNPQPAFSHSAIYVAKEKKQKDAIPPKMQQVSPIEPLSPTLT